MKRTHTNALFTTLLALSGISHGAVLFDDFSSDTSADYTDSDSFGSGGALGVSGGTLNLTPANGNTYSVVHTTSDLEVGERFSIDFLDPWSGSGNSIGGDGQFLMLTTGTEQPDGSSVFGFRLRVDSNSLMRLSTYSNGGNSTATTSTLNAAAPDTFWIDRITATDFQFSYGPAGGRTLITTGSLLATEVVGPLRIGVQAYSASGSELYNFDNLQIQAINSSEGFVPEPSVLSFVVFGICLLRGLRSKSELAENLPVS